MASRAVKGRPARPQLRSYDNEGRDSSRDSYDTGSRHRGTPSIASQDSIMPTKGDAPDGVALKKHVGLVSAIALIVGTMIGSGIFISPKGVAQGSGSVGFSLISWIICGLISTMGALSYAELGMLIPKPGGEYWYLMASFGGVAVFIYSGLGVQYPPATQLGALSYAELGTLIPKSGAEYPYLLDSFGKLRSPGNIGQIPAFLFAWVNMVLLRPAMVAIIILAFATYILEPFFLHCTSDMAAVKCLAALGILLLMLINCISVKLATGVQNVFTVIKIVAMIIIILGGVAMLILVILTWINCYSVKLATRVQVVFTAAKLIALIVIVIGGVVMLAQGHTETLSTGFEGTETSVGVIAIGLYNGMWAYDGWNNLNYVTEEIINPYRNLPLAIMIGIPLVTGLYVLVNISYFTVLTFQELLSSPAVAVTWGRRVLGPMWWIIPFFVACSTFGAANGTFFSSGRLTYVAAREGHMVELLSMIHVKRLTPLPSLVFTCIIALIMIIPGDIASLIDFFSFAVWMFYGATMAALLVLRWTMKDAERPYKVPIFIPIIVLLVSIYLVIAPIIDNPQIEFLYAAIFILAGLIFYVPFVHFKKELPGMGKFTLFMQMLMECSPPTDESEL